MKTSSKILFVFFVSLCGVYGLAIAEDMRFATVDGSGNIVAKLEKWDCIVDHTTGLVWQAKTFPHLVVSTGASTRALPGDVSSSSVKEIDTPREIDAPAYTQSVNDVSLCGSNQWRLPTLYELSSLVNLVTNKGAKVKSIYFPDIRAATYLTGNGYGDGGKVWVVSFADGSTQITDKTVPHYVLLVHN